MTRKYAVIISCNPLVDEEMLHPDDQEEAPRGDHKFVLTAESPDKAIDQALDVFHSTQPIKVLDDFEIDTELLLSSVSRSSTTKTVSLVKFPIATMMQLLRSN